MASRTHRGEVLVACVARCDLVPVKIGSWRFAIAEIVAVDIDVSRPGMSFKEDIVTVASYGSKAVADKPLQ